MSFAYSCHCGDNTNRSTFRQPHEETEPRELDRYRSFAILKLDSSSQLVPPLLTFRTSEKCYYALNLLDEFKVNSPIFLGISTCILLALEREGGRIPVRYVGILDTEAVQRSDVAGSPHRDAALPVAVWHKTIWTVQSKICQLSRAAFRLAGLIPTLLDGRPSLPPGRFRAGARRAGANLPADTAATQRP